MKTNPPTITTMDYQQTSTPPSPPPTPHKPNGISAAATTHPVHRTVATASNLANLLPTGSVLAFHTLIPSLSNNGTCLSSHKYLASTLLAVCSIMCFLSSFTDSFVDCDGKLYFGIATYKGLFVFNNNNETSNNPNDEEKQEDIVGTKDLSKFRISFIDFVHAFISLLVFLVFAFSHNNVQSCFFPKAGPDLDVLTVNLPLGAGIFSSLLFTLFPTTRRGIGYADTPAKFK